MEKVRNFISIIFIIGLTYLVSCDNNNLTSPIAYKSDILGINDSCYNDYINSGGECTSAALQCVNAYIVDSLVHPCNGVLKIEGTTCQNEAYNCIIPLNQTMICVQTKNVGPKVPFGYYKYTVCCELGTGYVWAYIPESQIHIIIDPNVYCQNQNENFNQ